MSRALHFRCYSTAERDARGLLDRPGARTVWLIRHGESAHQWRRAVARAGGGGCRCFDPDADAAVLAACPYLEDSLIDAPLTPHGLHQVTGRGRGLGVELVLTATMTRSLQTARAAFGAVPTLATESLRPRVGAHRHSRRAPLSRLRADFPDVSFEEAPEPDTLWSPADEPRSEIDRRIGRFLHLLEARPERRVGVVTHFTVFFALFSPADDSMLLGRNPERPGTDPAWFDCSNSVEAERLRGWLAPGELREYVLVPDR